MDLTLLIVACVVGFLTIVLVIAFIFVSRKNVPLDVEDPNNEIIALKRRTTEFGITFSELQFGKLLGKGSQGEVFQASWRGSNVAVKKIDTRKIDAEVIREFCKEAEIMRTLRHPTLTLFMGVCLEHPHLCIMTELVPRGSLFDIIQDPHSALTWIRCLGIALDVAQGMNYLHSHDPPILHRDLKSLNILVDNNWRAKVADFGMTRIHDANSTMTQCGSPLWMAPEMIQNIAYDEKSDVYSFGICLWELYARKIPYHDLNLASTNLVIKVVRDCLRPPILRSMPKPYVKLIEKCWHPNPAKRPTFSLIIKILETFLTDPAMINHKPRSRHGSVVTLDQPELIQEINIASSSSNVLDNSWRIEQEEVEIIGIAGGRTNAFLSSPTLVSPTSRLEQQTNALLLDRKNSISFASLPMNSPTAMRSSRQVYDSEPLSPMESKSPSSELSSSNEIPYNNQGEGVLIAKFRSKLVGLRHYEVDWKLDQVNNEQKVQADLAGTIAESKLIGLLRQLSHIRHPNLTLFMGAYVLDAPTAVEEEIKLIEIKPAIPFKRNRARLSSVQLLSFHDAGQIAVGIVQEHLYRGLLLDIVMNAKFMLGWNNTLQFLIDAASGINYLHQTKPQPIIHPDLQLNKLVVDENWRVKISDYCIGADLTKSVLNQYNSVGIYAAPEQLKEALNHRRKPSLIKLTHTKVSNIYSFGMIMWAVIARKQPFDCDELSDELRSKVCLHNYRPHISKAFCEELRSLITSCWHSDPSRRPSFDIILDSLMKIKAAGPPKLHLELGKNAFSYRTTKIVHAFQSKDPITIIKDWGQSAGKEGCMLICSEEEDVYVCDPTVFAAAYEQVGDPAEHLYRKLGTVLARCMKEAFAIKTVGRSVEHGMAGDYLVQNENGDQWSTEAKSFERLYERDGV